MDFKRRDFFISWGIYAFCFYFVLLIISILLFIPIQLSIETSKQSPPISPVGLFVLLAICANIPSIVFVTIGKRKARKDLISPINDSNGRLNCAYEHVSNFDRKYPFLKINFLKRNSQIASSYGPIYGAYLIGKDWLSACKNSEMLSSENHDAIVVPVYNRFSSSAMMGFGIDLLINFFHDNNHPFKIYLCETRENFLSVLNTRKAKRIWIFGHGNRGGVAFSNGSWLYSDLFIKLTSDGKEKEAIYQFHCNPGNKLSLVELLSVKKGFVNHSINDQYAIREYLTQIIKTNRFDELIMLN